MVSFTHSPNRLIYHLICLCLCACHRLPPKVGRRANRTCPRNDGLWGQEWANQGKKLGKTKGWIGFPVPGEGTTDDIVVTSNEIGKGNSKFCANRRCISGRFSLPPEREKRRPEIRASAVSRLSLFTIMWKQIAYRLS